LHAVLQTMQAYSCYCAEQKPRQIWLQQMPSGT